MATKRLKRGWVIVLEDTAEDQDDLYEASDLHRDLTKKCGVLGLRVNSVTKEHD